MSIEEGLNSMEINKFLLYDSYWSKDTSKLLTNAKIPVNVLSTYRVHEIEIVDTLMHSFACPESDNCRTSYLKRFTAVNSTVDDKGACNNAAASIHTWISCPGNIEMLSINAAYSSDTLLKPEFFPEPLSKLKTLSMPFNHISRIDKRTFSAFKFPSLETLDLSHNNLRDSRNLFSSSLKLTVLDLSHNFIRTVVDFQYLPKLKVLKLNNNNIVNLLESEWKVPESLKYIDLTNNDIQCNCGLKFINSTLHMNVMLLANCGSPEQLASRSLRKASRFLIERCTEDGKIGPPKKKPKKE